MSKAQRGHPRPSPNNAHSDPSGAILSTGATSTASDRAATSRRPTYPEAVARYEAGVRALQQHRFQESADAFRGVLTQYPEEKELVERVRVYLIACERQLSATSSEPQNQEQRLYAATLAMNAGDIETALRHLEAVVAEDGEHDGALYMLGVGYALRNDDGTAVKYLQRAIACNPSNRQAALRDGDLERLLRDESVRASLDSAAEAARVNSHHPPRPHSGR